MPDCSAAKRLQILRSQTAERDEGAIYAPTPAVRQTAMLTITTMGQYNWWPLRTAAREALIIRRSQPAGEDEGRTIAPGPPALQTSALLRELNDLLWKWLSRMDTLQRLYPPSAALRFRFAG